MAISPKFLLNWPNISQINVTEHHPEILICCLPDKGLCTVKKMVVIGPTFSFWVLKFVRYTKLKFKAELF